MICFPISTPPCLENIGVGRCFRLDARYADAALGKHRCRQAKHHHKRKQQRYQSFLHLRTSLSIASFSLCLVRRGFVVHLPRLPVLDGSSCPGSRFTAHTPRLPTSIFVHCNIKTLYYSLLGYHTNNILTRWNLAIFPISRTIGFFINSDNRGETSRKSGRTQSIKGSSGFFCTFCCCLSRVQNSHRRRRLAAALPYFFSAFAFSRLIWRRFLTASSIGWISPAACRAILVSSGPTSS